MSTNKKRVLTIITAAVAMLTLISIYLLGSTYAKYIANGTGSSSDATIAAWSVTDNSGSASWSFSGGKLSPDYNTTFSTTEARTNKIDASTYCTLTNASDVKAWVTFTCTVTITLKSGIDYDGTGYSIVAGSISGSGASQGQVEGRFAAVANVYTSTAPLTEASKVSGEDYYEMAVGSSTAQYLYFGASLTWSSYYGSAAGDETLSNYIDTWIGEYVEKVTVTVNWTAEQASEVPSV